LATAPAVDQRKPIWHTRAAWSGRDDRRSFAVWLALLWLGILAGFGVDLSRFFREAPPAPLVVDVHAAVFTGWMLLLTAQVLLVLGNRVALHRRLGWLLAGWAGLMLILGPWAALASQTVVIPGPNYDPPFLSVQFGGVTAFFLLLIWGIVLRGNPAAHKRIMIVSSVALVDAGYNRFIEWLIGPTMPQSRLVWYLWAFYGNIAIVASMAAWDWWRGRLMKQFALAAAGLLAWEGMEDLLYHWGPWKTFTTGLIAAWARHFH
jgi:hypothetical protein